MKKKYLIGIDLGGTKILTGVLDERFRVRETEKLRLEPHKGEKNFLDTLVQSVRTVLDKEQISMKEIKAIGMGCPGMIDTVKGIVELSPNIKFLKNYPLKKRLSNRLGIPVTLENDANAGLYGEYSFGAAKKARHAVGLFLGTGIGGAIIIDGKLYRGADHAAGEIGHMYLSLDVLDSAMTRPGTFENLCGRLAMTSEAAHLLLQQKTPHLYDSIGFNIKKLKSRVFKEAMDSGDRELGRLLTRKAQIVGLAMANIVHVLNPEMIVLGGGLMEALGKIILPVAERTMRRIAMEPLVRNVKVRASALKDLAIVMGAAKLAWDEKQGNSRG